MLATKSVTVRNIPLDVHNALRLRAARHQHSTEAEIRAILAAAVAPTRRQGALDDFFNTLPENIKPEKPISIEQMNAIIAAGWAGQLNVDDGQGGS